MTQQANERIDKANDTIKLLRTQQRAMKEENAEGAAREAMRAGQSAAAWLKKSRSHVPKSYFRI